MTRVILYACLLLASTATQAHGIWVVQRAGALEVVYGEGKEEEAYDPARITAIRAWRADGERVDWRSQTKGQRLLIHAPAVARLAMHFDAGEWTQTTEDQWLPGGRDAGVPDALRTWRLLRFASVLLAPPDGSAGRLGLPLEIQPLADPLTLGRGEALPVRVLLHGEPLPGAKVIADFVNADSAPPVITDGDGVAHVVLGGDGLNVLQTGHAEACVDECTTDRIGYSATLSFTLLRLEDRQREERAQGGPPQ